MDFFFIPDSSSSEMWGLLFLSGQTRENKMQIKDFSFSSTDVVNLDLKSTLRVLYNLFTKYKNVE